MRCLVERERERERKRRKGECVVCVKEISSFHYRFIKKQHLIVVILVECRKKNKRRTRRAASYCDS